MDLQVGVKVLLKNKEGKFLFLRRNLTKYPEMKERPWDFPGGRINPGLPLLENLKREVKEEAGLDLVGEPKLIAAQDILKNDRHVVRLTYVADADGKKPVLSDEHDSFEWFTLEEVQQLPGLDQYLLPLLKNL